MPFGAGQRRTDAARLLSCDLLPDHPGLPAAPARPPAARGARPVPHRIGPIGRHRLLATVDHRRHVRARRAPATKSLSTAAARPKRSTIAAMTVVAIFRGDACPRYRKASQRHWHGHPAAVIASRARRRHSVICRPPPQLGGVVAVMPASRHAPRNGPARVCPLNHNALPSCWPAPASARAVTSSV